MSSITDTLTKHYEALFVCPFHQAVLASTVVTLSASMLLFRSTKPPPKSIPSPRNLKPTKDTPYPPNLLPGSRFVSTPHGTISVAEFGPATGRKILLVHGISTPSVVFGSLASALAADGYRVMTFDLFGRGYSDAPQDVEYDERLFSTQILYALYSSPLSWERFSLVGYSLGGGIAVAFASHFAARLEALVLFAPAGILKANKLGLLVKLARGGWVPKAIETWMLQRHLGVRTKAHATDIASEDGLDYAKIMKWQATTHAGFPMAFQKSFRNGPLYDREEEWKTVAKQGIERVGVMVGGKDDVIPPNLLPDMVALLGGANRVRGEVLPDAGHNLIRDRWRECMDFVVDIVGYPDEDEDIDDSYDESMATSRSSYVVNDF
ncbi:Alpha/Beta hydrolase protein [Pyronema domesticum]|uniref:Similar to Uncharacterized protein Rv2715/MT2788 acc. no. P0A572 n=1 Tax=Pyronema omphalodes (strain CBS 100304) TaxID=1076935 RepID=U4L6A0_PYROM|nr:Alpha/Beta hydrolase protein [Pyronema domesticum]CCX07961.1 Similar to Uncharacterized protein Rv2715/MT2788; acc. no. P0A572 [Pyronema omphalodes CBS 100304]